MVNLLNVGRSATDRMLPLHRSINLDIPIIKRPQASGEICSIMDLKRTTKGPNCKRNDILIVLVFRESLENIIVPECGHNKNITL